MGTTIMLIIIVSGMYIFIMSFLNLIISSGVPDKYKPKWFIPKRFKQDRKSPIYKLKQSDYYYSDVYLIQKWSLGWNSCNGDTSFWVLLLPFFGVFRTYGYVRDKESFCQFEEEELYYGMDLEFLYEKAYSEKYRKKLVAKAKAEEFDNMIHDINGEFHQNYTK